MYYTAERVMKKWLKEAKLKEDIYYNIDYNERIITIYTTRPGWLIGKQGYLVEKYTSIMQDKWNSFVGFKFIEVWGCVHYKEDV